MSPDAKLDLQMARLKLILTFQDKYQVISNDVPWIQRLLGKRGLWKLLKSETSLSELTIALLGGVHAHVAAGYLVAPPFLDVVTNCIEKKEYFDAVARLIEHNMLPFESVGGEQIPADLILAEAKTRLHSARANEDYCLRLICDIGKCFRQLMNLNVDGYRGDEAQKTRQLACELLIECLLYTPEPEETKGNGDAGKKYEDNGDKGQIGEYRSNWLQVYEEDSNSKLVRWTPPDLEDHHMRPRTGEWIFRMMDDLLTTQPENLLVVNSTPHWGTSCFLNAVCKKYPEKVVAKYFVDDTASKIDLKLMCESLAAELCRHLPEFAWHFNNLDLEFLKKMNPKEALDRLIGEPMMHLYAPDEPDFDTTIFQESVHPTASGELADSEDRPQTPSQRCFGGGGVANAIWGIPDHFAPPRSPRKGRGSEAPKLDCLAQLSELIGDRIIGKTSCSPERVTRPLEPSDKQYLIVVDLSTRDQVKLSELNDFLLHLVSLLPPQLKMIIGVGVGEEAKVLKGLKYTSISSREHVDAHIADLDNYVVLTMGDILSEQCADAKFGCCEKQLEDAVNDILAATAGRFDYATELMANLEDKLALNDKQIMTSLKRIFYEISKNHYDHKEECDKFSNFFRAFRIRNGSPNNIRFNSVSFIDKVKIKFIQ